MLSILVLYQATQQQGNLKEIFIGLQILIFYKQDVPIPIGS